MLATLRRPRWVALTLLVIVLGTAMVELGMWQLRRGHERAMANSLVEANAASAPVPVAALLRPDTPLPDGSEWRVVTVTGRFDEAGQILVRNQSFDGKNGYDVVTPLRPASGPALLVDRGWVPAADRVDASPDVAPPPAGEVSVQARLHPGVGSTTHDLEGLPSGQVRGFAIASIASTLDYPVYDAYAESLSGQPGTGSGGSASGSDLPLAHPLPELTGGPHLAYAIQWFLFTGIAIGGWVVLLRNESQAPARTPGQGWAPSAAQPAGDDTKGDGQLSTISQ